MPKQVVLEESVLFGLLGRHDVLGALPILKSAAEQLVTTKRCGRCHRHHVGNVNYAAVKQAIMALTPEAKQLLKGFLQAEQLLLVYKDTAGKVQRQTI